MVDGQCPGLMSLDDMRRFDSKINLNDIVVQMRGKNRPLEQTSSGHPIADMTDYPMNDTATVTNDISVSTIPGAMRIDTQEHLPQLPT